MQKNCNSNLNIFDVAKELNSTPQRISGFALDRRLYLFCSFFCQNFSSFLKISSGGRVLFALTLLCMQRVFFSNFFSQKEGEIYWILLLVVENFKVTFCLHLIFFTVYLGVDHD
eukprot:TRINITY_DN34628_c0_g2_i1.p4 TRINITY_DN34628_c0_g2~~TRINITY_DN34628_c0_g2_i1.p4  ORF type:complete len:114 (-),score=11.05 TRINITY_DN34628_c0_g2_i1:478-819(-)